MNYVFIKGGLYVVEICIICIENVEIYCSLWKFVFEEINLLNGEEQVMRYKLSGVFYYVYIEGKGELLFLFYGFIGFF